jgi:hypothetical protein
VTVWRKLECKTLAGATSLSVAEAIQARRAATRACGDPGRKFELVISLKTAMALGLTHRSPCSRAPTRWPSDDTFLAAVHESESGRFCCKSRFALVRKNSKGYWRGFRINM